MAVDAQGVVEAGRWEPKGGPPHNWSRFNRRDADKAAPTKKTREVATRNAHGIHAEQGVVKRVEKRVRKIPA